MNADGVNFWLSDCKNLGIVEDSEESFEVHYRLYSSLENHDHTHFPSYREAREYLKIEHFLEGRLKVVSKEEFQ